MARTWPAPLALQREVRAYIIRDRGNTCEWAGTDIPADPISDLVGDVHRVPIHILAFPSANPYSGDMEVVLMIPIVEEHRDEIIALCEENEIKGFWLFGSAATGEWDPERSDLDFLFDIGEYDDTAGRRFMSFAVGLERLFGENFDLVSRPAIRRPEFRESVERTAIPIYER